MTYRDDRAALEARVSHLREELATIRARARELANIPRQQAAVLKELDAAERRLLRASPRSARPRRWQARAAALLMALGGVVVSMSEGDPAPGPALDTGVASIAKAAAGRSITVEVKALPAEARFSLDGGPPVGVPFRGHFLNDGKTHELRVEAPGHRPISRLVTFDRDLVFDVALEREGMPRRPASNAPSRRLNSNVDYDRFLAESAPPRSVPERPPTL